MRLITLEVQILTLIESVNSSAFLLVGGSAAFFFNLLRPIFEVNAEITGRRVIDFPTLLHRTTGELNLPLAIHSFLVTTVRNVQKVAAVGRFDILDHAHLLFGRTYRVLNLGLIRSIYDVEMTR